MRSNYKRLGPYIKLSDEINNENTIEELQGISNQKHFQRAKTNTVGIDLKKYRVVRTGQFAFNRATTRNGDKISIALRENNDCIVSPSYRIFQSIDENVLSSEYLMMWFRRPEFDRYARFKSHGSAHEFFDYKEMCDVELPIPSIEKQKEIVDEYSIVEDRISSNSKLINKLEEAIITIYKQWFIHGVELKNLQEGWSRGCLEDMSEIITAGTIPNYSINGNDFVLGQRCVHSHIVDLKFARPHEPKKNCTFLKFGDILINSTGSGTLGRVGQIYFEPNRLAFDSNMTLVRAAKDCYIEYLGCFLSQKESYFVQISQGSTNQTRLYCSMVSPVEIIIPEYNVLEAFSLKIRPIRVLSQKIREENKALIKLEEILLSKLSTIDI